MYLYSNKSGIVAVYFYDQRSNTNLDWVGIGNDFLKEDSDESSLEDEDGNKIHDAYKTIRFEYLDKKGVKELLHTRVKVNHAILQAFVEPRDAYNNTIYVDWSKSHCKVERRFSKVKLHDKRYSIQQRGTTFEKMEGVTNKINVTYKAILEAINEEIVKICEYIQKNSPRNYEINNMSLMMKVDRRGRINLLWTPYVKATKMDYPRRPKKKNRHKLKALTSEGLTNLGLGHKRHSSVTTYKNSKVCFLALTDKVEQFAPISQIKPIAVFKDKLCPSCGNEDVEDKMIKVKLPFLIKQSVQKISRMARHQPDLITPGLPKEESEDQDNKITDADTPRSK